MMRVAALFALLSVASATSFGTWYRDNAADHACFFRGDTAVTTTVAFNPANWPSTGAWAGKARCGTCFTVSCNSGASTFGISGATSCAGRSVLAQLTNKCPECSERKGSWGSCDTCSGFHVDLWSDTFAALTGCDPTKGGCNPGIIPLTIGDPVPCPGTTPKIFYRDSQSFFQLFQVTGMGAAFVSASIPGGPAFRVQTNEIGGVLLALDSVQPSQLPGTFTIVVNDADGRTFSCQVTNSAAGAVFPCGGGSGGGAVAPPPPVNPPPKADPPPKAAPAVENSEDQKEQEEERGQGQGQGQGQEEEEQPEGLGASNTAAVTAESTTPGNAPKDCESLRPVSKVSAAGVNKDYAAYKQCAIKTPGAWPPKSIEGTLAEYQQCGDDKTMPYATRCEFGTICCQTEFNYAQCIDVQDGPAIAKCTTKF